MALELRQLRYFMTVAREGTYGRAAHRLNVAQPALSRQIRKLELELGIDLFVRHPQGVTLTPAARDLTARVAHILDELSALKHMADQHARDAAGCVKIGMSPGTAEILAFPLSRLTAARYPKLRCQFVSMLMPARADLLREGRMNLAVMNKPDRIDGLQIIPVMQEPLCLIHHPDDTRFQGKTLSLLDLVNVPLVLSGETTSGIRGSLSEAFEALGHTLTIAAEANTAGACKSLVKAGVGPTVHVAAMARAELENGGLRAVPIRDQYSTRVIALPLGHEISSETRVMIRLVYECLNALIRDGLWIGGQMLPFDKQGFASDSRQAL